MQIWCSVLISYVLTVTCNLLSPVIVFVKLMLLYMLFWWINRTLQRDRMFNILTVVTQSKKKTKKKKITADIFSSLGIFFSFSVCYHLIISSNTPCFLSFHTHISHMNTHTHTDCSGVTHVEDSSSWTWMAVFLPPTRTQLGRVLVSWLSSCLCFCLCPRHPHLTNFPPMFRHHRHHPASSKTQHSFLTPPQLCRSLLRRTNNTTSKRSLSHTPTHVCTHTHTLSMYTTHTHTLTHKHARTHANKQQKGINNAPSMHKCTLTGKQRLWQVHFLETFPFINHWSLVTLKAHTHTHTYWNHRKAPLNFGGSPASLWGSNLHPSTLVKSAWPEHTSSNQLSYCHI